MRDFAHTIKKHIVFIALYVCMAIFVCFKLTSMPPLWFDEGWALSVARNWLEMGHYGLLLSGQPIPITMLNTGFPVLILQTLSFKLFGIGLWQARIPWTIVVLLVFLFLYLLINRLFNAKIATLAIILSILAPAQIDLHPIVLGRQVLGEMLAILFLILGYGFLYIAWNRKFIMLLVPAVFWALALETKPQVIPFFCISIVFVLVYYLKQRDIFSKLLTSSIFTVLVYILLKWGWRGYIQSLPLTSLNEAGSYEMENYLGNALYYIVVLFGPGRLNLLKAVLFSGYGLVSAIGVVWFAFYLFKIRRSQTKDSIRNVINISLWALSFSWIMWYIFLSVGWPRYAFPGVFLGNIYAALLINNIYTPQKLEKMLLKGSSDLRTRRIPYQGVVFALFTGILLFALYSTIGQILYASSTASDAVVDVTSYLNQTQEEDALIETYESELFFLLDGTYHYPPDIVQHTANRRRFLGHDVVIDYDPLEMDPDYIVVGLVNSWWHVYDTAIASDAYDLVFEKGIYQVYNKTQ